MLGAKTKFFGVAAALGLSSKISPAFATSFTFATFDVPSATATFGEGINSAGQIVGYYSYSMGSPHGFLYSGGVYTTFDDPLGYGGTVGLGINDSGQIVGYFRDEASTASSLRPSPVFQVPSSVQAFLVLFWEPFSFGGCDGGTCALLRDHRLRMPPSRWKL
jgi:probable HAF family extracellular repeat protein